MPLAHDLPRLSVRCCKAEPHEHVIQPPFQLRQQVFACNAFLTDGFLEVRSELVFENAINALHLLLLAELEPISDDLCLTIAPVLPRSKIAFLDSAGRLETTLAFQK